MSPDLVLDNLWPHRLAGVGLLVLLVAVVRSERGRPTPPAEE